MGDYIMSTIKANDIQNASGGIPTVKGQKLIPTAWVNFNGTAGTSIRDAEGISSVVDIATGRWDVNFTVALANADYAVTVGSNDTTNIGSGNATSPYTFAHTTTDFSFVNLNYQGSWSALTNLSAIVMGGQA